MTSVGDASRPDTGPSRDEVLRAAREVMGAARYCALITLDENDHPQARAMDPFPPENDMRVWMGTNRTTRKVEQLLLDSQATLYYFDSGNPGYVTLIGEARFVDDPDKKRKHWKEDWFYYYPGGPEGDDYLLIEFIPWRLEMISVAHAIADDPKGWEPFILELEEPGE